MSSRKILRQEKILVELHSGANLRVADLARSLEVSTETIRRDLDELTRLGRLDRTYGGATRPIASEPGVVERHNLFAAERERIAKAASACVENGQVLMIGSGATTVHVARRIAAEKQNLTIFTHSYGVATVMASNPTINVIMAPGSYNGAEGAVIGSHAIAFLMKFSGDLAILGASGLTAEGPNEALVDSAAIYTLMTERCNSAMIVADHSKLNQAFPVCFQSWSGISRLVTDQEVSGAIGKAIRSKGVEIIVA